MAKLKNKLGTRQLPTAELLLDGAEAVMVGEEGRGIANISSMLTVTRYVVFVKPESFVLISLHSGCTTPQQQLAQCER